MLTVTGLESVPERLAGGQRRVQRAGQLELLVLRTDRQPVLLCGAGIHLGLLAGAALVIQDGSITMKDHVLRLCPRVLHCQLCRHLNWLEEETRRSGDG